MVSYPNHTCSWASLLGSYQYLVHILPPVTNNCSSWINGRGRMAVDIFSWPSLHERMCQTWGSNSGPLACQGVNALGNNKSVFDYRRLVGWLCWGLTSQSTIFQSCRDGAIASWVINQYFRGVKCLAQGHNTAAVGLKPRTSRSGVRHSTTEPPRSPTIEGRHKRIVSQWC